MFHAGSCLPLQITFYLRNGPGLNSVCPVCERYCAIATQKVKCTSKALATVSAYSIL